MSRHCLHAGFPVDDVLMIFASHLLYFLPFQNVVMSSLSFDHPFSFANLKRRSQSCSTCCPCVLLLCDNCRTMSAITSVLLAVGSQDVSDLPLLEFFFS